MVIKIRFRVENFIGFDGDNMMRIALCLCVCNHTGFTMQIDGENGKDFWFHGAIKA